MSGPVLVWEHLAAGFVKPLDQFFDRASDVRPVGLGERLCSATAGAAAATLSGGTALGDSRKRVVHRIMPVLKRRSRVPKRGASTRDGRAVVEETGAASAVANGTGACTRCTRGSRPSSGRRRCVRFRRRPLSLGRHVVATLTSSPPRCRPRRLAESALVRARARLRAWRIRFDRRLRPLRRVFRRQRVF
jgi:hypothetical protein